MNLTVFAFCMLLFAGSASADVCDYRPSELIGAKATATTAGVSGSMFTAGAGLKALGFYTLEHAGSGSTMLGSTLAGESAAGTAGILAGTGNGIGAVAAFLMSAPVLAVTGVIAGTLVVYEGGCEIARRAGQD